MKENEELTLKTLNGEIDFVYHNSILREKSIYSEAQSQSQECFEYKWKKKETYENDHVIETVHRWLLEKYFNNDESLMKDIFKKDSNVLDAGCGSGVSALALLKDRLEFINYLGADISGAVDVAKERFAAQGAKGEFMQCDLNSLPFEQGHFDVIFSEGVLHHTDSTEMAIKRLTLLLKKGGKFLFYVYAKKAPIREYG